MFVCTLWCTTLKVEFNYKTSFILKKLSFDDTQIRNVFLVSNFNLLPNLIETFFIPWNLTF